MGSVFNIINYGGPFHEYNLKSAQLNPDSLKEWIRFGLKWRQGAILVEFG